jgi:hypothetical protein
VSEWARREAALVAALAVAAAAAALAKPLDAAWLGLAGLVIAVVGALVRMLIAVNRARLEGRQERVELGRLLRAPVAPVGGIDPTVIGVDPAAQSILPGGRLPAYVERDAFDAGLREAVRAGLDGSGPWLLVVVGPSKVGKSRALFEALRRCGGEVGLQLVAPTDGAALRTLLLPGHGVRLARAPAALWLDDIEPFLNQGLTLETLREWHSSGLAAGSWPPPTAGKAVNSLPAPRRPGCPRSPTWSSATHARFHSRSRSPPTRPGFAADSTTINYRRSSATAWPPSWSPDRRWNAN